MPEELVTAKKELKSLSVFEKHSVYLDVFKLKNPRKPVPLLKKIPLTLAGVGYDSPIDGKLTNNSNRQRNCGFLLICDLMLEQVLCQSCHSPPFCW